MSNRGKRNAWAAVVVCAAGMLFQALPTGCADYYTATVTEAIDFCTIFNCTGGTFFNFCEPTALFLDCPNLTATQ